MTTASASTSASPSTSEEVLARAIIRWYRASGHEAPRHVLLTAERDLKELATRLLGEEQETLE